MALNNMILVIKGEVTPPLVNKRTTVPRPSFITLQVKEFLYTSHQRLFIPKGEAEQKNNC